MSNTLLSKNRLESLSDGIYAIALTLLVLNLQLPPLAESSNAALSEALIALYPHAMVWLLSFWVMAKFWLNQQRSLRYFALLDRRCLSIELTQLAAISLMPFSTQLIGEYGNLGIASAIYAANIALLALLSLLRLQWLLHTPVLQAKDSDLAQINLDSLNAGIALTAALLATALAFPFPGWNMLAMLLISLSKPIRRWVSAKQSDR